MNILVADDSPVTLKLLQKILESWGHNVTACVDGEEAWEAISNSKSTELCVVDWDMPGFSGLEICEKVRAAGLNKYLIFLTAKDEPENIAIGINAGADDYMCKPFIKEEMLIRMRAATRILHLEKKLGMNHTEFLSKSAS